MIFIVIFIGRNTHWNLWSRSFVEMGSLVLRFAIHSTILWAFQSGLVHVHCYQGHFMTKEFPATVLHTTNLECHTINSRSPLELASVCSDQDSCMGMKTHRNWGIFGMLCSCPNGPTWPDVSSLSITPMTHLRTQQRVEFPGKWW